MRIVSIHTVFLLFLMQACQIPESQVSHTVDFEYELEAEFAVEKVAGHPQISDPVVLSFDGAGRMYVVEMRGYMPNIEGLGEGKPVGRIRVLEDTDQDGRADRSRVLLDNLVQPRAVLAVYGGLLYAEPPNLWFVPLEAGVPGEKELVDPVYAVGGNVEHQPNGLLLALDNWIYSAKGKARYRRKGKKWLKEPTEFRGQWGITQDDAGRLFYNDNSNQLQGDYLWPGSLLRNPDFPARQGINVIIAEDQSVFPAHATPGINRGYRPAMLTSDGRLSRFTAACGPLIYRGDQFPADFYGNAFVAEPAGNLIKRNILWESEGIIRAEQAYTDREFLAAKEEVFRPVNLYNAPDGSMYVLDFYRGIIQHKTYLTDYLREQILQRDLDKVVGGGRILRIRARDIPLGKYPNLYQASSETLVSLLEHPNAWHREQSQRLLIERRAWSVVPALKALVRDGSKSGSIHALWTLEGLKALDEELLLEQLLGAKELSIQLQVMRLAAEYAEAFPSKSKQLIAGFCSLESFPHPERDLHLAMALGNMVNLDSAQLVPVMASLADRYSSHPLYQDVLLSGLEGKEKMLLGYLSEQSQAQGNWRDLVDDILFRREKQTDASQQSVFAQSALHASGKKLYVHHCSGCHQEDGRGRIPLAPPLRNSEWVLGHPERLAMIALLGLEGPITVNGQRYESPHIAPHMPGLKDNKDFSSEDIAAILSYVRNAWGHKASNVNTDLVARIRREQADRQEMCTEPELLEWKSR